MSYDISYLIALREQDQYRVRVGLENVRGVIQAHLRSPQIWRATLALNPPYMNCVINGTDCSAYNGTYTPLPVLASSEGTTVQFDSNISSNGFTLRGEPCNAFGSSGEIECIVRPIIDWTTGCSASPCIDRPTLVRVRFQLIQINDYKINVVNHEFTEYLVVR